jgi:hypothetical protein
MAKGGLNPAADTCLFCQPVLPRPPLPDRARRAGLHTVVCRKLVAVQHGGDGDPPRAHAVAR